MRFAANSLAAFVVVILTSATFSDTIVPEGLVDGIWKVESSPYIVQGPISVADGNSLIIEPGVVVLFETGGLNVYGTMMAGGDVNDPIIFTSAADEPNAGDWSGISVYTSDCNLTHCVIEFASTGIKCDESSPNITNCVIQRNMEGIYIYARGIYCLSRNANPTIVSCIISENQGNGLNFKGVGHQGTKCVTGPRPKGTAAGTLSNCEIFGNGDCGVYLSAKNGPYTSGSVCPTIANNVISNNVNDGIRIVGDGTTVVRIEDNDISENLGSGINCTSTSFGPSVLYNFISRNGGEGVYNVNNNATIEYNHIINNDSNGVVTIDLKSFQKNGILNNKLFQCMYLGLTEQAAPNNDWGTSDSQEIDVLIYDHLDDPNVGILQYTPFESIDDSKPTVVSVLPVDGESDVGLDIVIVVTFSEDIRASTLNTNTVMLSDGEDIIPGKTIYSEGILKFVPDKLLKGDTVYTLTLSSDIQEATYLKNHIDGYVTSFVTINN
jgi:parallel beta-helix repeat protein